MNFENNKKYRALSLPMVLICISLTFWAFIIFSKAVNPEWLFVGDTINNLAQYSYHYSGIARGELPLWNPLVRAGEPEDIFYAMQLATHILNLVAVSSVLLGITNIVLSFSMYIYVCIFLYVAGVYFLVSSWTNNRYAGAFASILAIGSSTVYWYAYHISFIQILHTIPWMLYAFLMYFKEFKLKYLIMFVLSFCIALYTYSSIHKICNIAAKEYAV